MRKLCAPLLLAALTCAACRSVPPRPAAPTPEPGFKEAAMMDWKGQFSGVVQGSQRIVKSAAEWRALWAEIGQAAPGEPDFKSSFAVAVFLGQRSTGGYGVKWLEADTSGPAVVVRYQEITPRGMAMQVLTQPFAVKLFPRTAADIKVEARPD